MRPIIALIGRPNVGKSTLFNFLTQSRDALVADFPGLTRDRKYGISTRYQRPCVIVDTGGITHAYNELDQSMQTQTDRAVDEAHLVLLLVDAQQGLVPEDQVIVEELRKRGIEFVLVVNKIDGADSDVVAGEFYQLGARHLFTIAAKQGRGVESMMDDLLASLELPEVDLSDYIVPEHEEAEEELLPEWITTPKPNWWQWILQLALDRCLDEMEERHGEPNEPLDSSFR